jgi:hypothetical protein
MQQVRNSYNKFLAKYCSTFYPISTIALQSITPTEDTMKQTMQLLYVIAIHDGVVLTCQASDTKIVARIVVQATLVNHRE